MDVHGDLLEVGVEGSSQVEHEGLSVEVGFGAAVGKGVCNLAGSLNSSKLDVGG